MIKQQFSVNSLFYKEPSQFGIHLENQIYNQLIFKFLNAYFIFLKASKKINLINSI